MLSRRWLVNGLLILAIAALATVGYLSDPESDGGPSPAVPTLDAASVERIEILTSLDRLTLQKQESGWVLIEPLRWPVDSASVERLIRITEAGGAQPIEAAEADLARFGFDNPVARLHLGDIRVSFGIVNIIGERRYTMIDSALYLLPDLYLPFIQQGPPGFVDRRLLPPEFKLEALSLPGMELRRDEDGNWHSVEDANVDPQRLAALAADWQTLAATRVGAYDNPAAPMGRIVAELDDGQKFEFLLLSVDPELVIANPGLGLQYHFRPDRYHRLLAPRENEAAA